MSESLTFSGVKMLGSKFAREQKGQGAKVPGNELAREWKGHGANWPGSELPSSCCPIRSLERIGLGAKRLGTFQKGSQKALELTSGRTSHLVRS